MIQTTNIGVVVRGAIMHAVAAYNTKRGEKAWTKL